MTEVNGKVFCTKQEYLENKVSKYFEVGDKITIRNLDCGESLVHLNNVGCKLSIWTPCDGTENIGELREY